MGDVGNQFGLHPLAAGGVLHGNLNGRLGAVEIARHFGENRDSLYIDGLVQLPGRHPVGRFPDLFILDGRPDPGHADADVHHEQEQDGHGV